MASSDYYGVVDGLQYMTTDERHAHKVDVSTIATPSSVSQVKAYDTQDDSDVTSTVYPTNSPSVIDDDSDGTDDSVQLSLLRALTKNHTYRVEILWVDTSSNYWETMFEVACLR